MSAEALIRLIDPEVGFVSPGEFIPIAEKNGMILRIGDMVFEKVFKFLASNDVQSMGVNYVEINLSVVQCMQRELADNVLNMMKEFGVSENMINLEITETAVADSPKTLLDNMNVLGNKGISFAMDDFGTGYSNCERLIGLPIDIIKFDRSLTILSSKNEESEFMVGSFSEIFKKAEYQILFEGVEDETDEQRCINMNAQYLQGYKYSKPIPMEHLKDFLEKK